VNKARQEEVTKASSIDRIMSALTSSVVMSEGGGRRSQELKKKLQRRNNSLRPGTPATADLVKEKQQQYDTNSIILGEGDDDAKIVKQQQQSDQCTTTTTNTTTNIQEERNKLSSDVRKRIEERKREIIEARKKKNQESSASELELESVSSNNNSNKLGDIQQYIDEYKPSSLHKRMPPAHYYSAANSASTPTKAARPGPISNNNNNNNNNNKAVSKKSITVNNYYEIKKRERREENHTRNVSSESTTSVHRYQGRRTSTIGGEDDDSNSILEKELREDPPLCDEEVKNKNGTKEENLAPISTTTAATRRSPIIQKHKLQGPPKPDPTPKNQHGNTKNVERLIKGYNESKIHRHRADTTPMHIEVKSNINDDGVSEVSEITTDVIIAGKTIGRASYAGGHRLDRSKLKKNTLAQPFWTSPPGHHPDNDDNDEAEATANDDNANNDTINCNIIDDRKQFGITTDPRHHDLLYEEMDYSSDDNDDDGHTNSWGDSIECSNKKQLNKNSAAVNDDRMHDYYDACIQQQDPSKTLSKNDDNNSNKNKPVLTKFSINKVSSKGKLQTLVKETFSHQGHVFIDTTQVEEDDLDDEYDHENCGSREYKEEGMVLSNLPEDCGDRWNPIKVDDMTIDTSMLLGDDVLSQEEAAMNDFTAIANEQERIASNNDHNNDDAKSSHNKGQVVDEKYQDDENKRTNQTQKRGGLPVPPSPYTLIRSKNANCNAKDPNPNRGINDDKTYVNGFDDNEDKTTSPTLIISNNLQPCDDDDVVQIESSNTATMSNGDSKTKPPSKENKCSSTASEFYTSSVGFFKSITNQVDTQLKTFTGQGGLIPERNVDGLLGVLSQDLDESERKLPKEGDDMVVMLGDELETQVCGMDCDDFQTEDKRNITENVESQRPQQRPDSIEQMVESVRKSYNNSSLSNCGGIMSENTKAIEEMVAALTGVKNKNTTKKASTPLPSSLPSKPRAQTPEPQTFIVPVNMHYKEDNLYERGK